MTSPYSSQPITGYNSNPPADDGSAVSTNQITWASNKTKLSDPIKTRTDNMDSALVTAFTKVLGGGGITSVSTDYTIQATDQGKLVRATASLALTLGDATTFLSPFIHGFVNLSGVAITVSGGGGQTIDGKASITIAPGAGFVAQTDGANWFSLGLQGTLIGNQLMSGDIINGTLSQSNTSNAVTFAVKTLAGADPSSTDPVLVCFRNATVGTGNFVYRTVTAALSFTVSSGSTLGTSSGVACRVWIGLLDNAGTVEMFAINCLSGVNIYPLGQFPIITTTAEGGAGAADSAQVAYSASARSAKAYVVFGYAEYATGLATAGSWNANPTRIQLYGLGVKLPGDVIQIQRNTTGVVATGTTVLPADNTIPQNTEGDQYMSQAITPTSAANILEVDHTGTYTATVSDYIAAALFQDSTANAAAVTMFLNSGSANAETVSLNYCGLAGATSSTTFKIRAGVPSGTLSFNGTAGIQKYGGVLASYLRVREIMA